MDPMLKRFPPFTQAVALAAFLALAMGLNACPAWAGTITSPTQVSFSQTNAYGMGNFNLYSGSLYQTGTGLSANTFSVTDGAYSPAAQPPVSAPEPASWLLLAAGLCALAIALQRRRVSAS
jgi:hypothetical protein